MVPRQRLQRFSRNEIIAIAIPAVLSVLALLISVFSLYEAHKTRMLALTDEVQLTLQRSNSVGYMLKEEKLGEDDMMVVQFSGMLANTGASVVSLTGMTITERKDKGWSFYPGLSIGIFDSSTNERLKFPIILESGKSQRVNVFVGIKPGPKAFKLIKNYKPKSIYDCEDMLAKNGLDIYDNHVQPGWAPNGKDLQTYKRIPPIIQQQFELEMKTTRGSKLVTQFGWYENI